jgi:hypothetical protein
MGSCVKLVQEAIERILTFIQGQMTDHLATSVSALFFRMPSTQRKAD